MLITGEIIRAPELRFTSNGIPICLLTITRVGDEEVRCVAWTEMAESISQDNSNFKTGTWITVKGIFRDRTYVGQDQEKHTVREFVIWEVL